MKRGLLIVMMLLLSFGVSYGQKKNSVIIKYWKKRSKTSQKTGDKGEYRTLQKSFEMLKKRSKTCQN
jgi:hypothetical protein